METKTMKDWMDEEPFTLVLSCGFFAFYTHSGVLCALQDSGVTPGKIAGCSAGAIVGAAWASGTDAYDIKDSFFNVDHGAFMDPGWGLGIIKGDKLDASLRKIIASDFDDCKIPMQIVAYDVMKFKAVTLKSGNLPAAVRASSAVPGMFQPVKHGNRWYYDGALHDRVGLTGIAREERVFCHFIDFDFYDHDHEFQALRARNPEQAKLMVLKDMPGVNILDLNVGKTAWQIAYDKTMETLSQPVSKDHVVEVPSGHVKKPSKIKIPKPLFAAATKLMPNPA